MLKVQTNSFLFNDCVILSSLEERMDYEYSIKREEWYKKECYNIAFDFKVKIIVEDNTVHLLKDNEKTMFLKPLGKQFWFETWIELRNHFNTQKVYHRR